MVGLKHAAHAFFPLAPLEGSEVVFARVAWRYSLLTQRKRVPQFAPLGPYLFELSSLVEFPRAHIF